MHHRIRPIRTAAVALSTAALGVGVLAAPPDAAEPSPALRAAKATAGTDSTPSTIAAEWISDELTNGLMMGTSGPDFGLTIDTGMAVSTVARQGATVAAITNALEPRIGDYVGDGTKESYAGPLAKAARRADVIGATSSIAPWAPPTPYSRWASASMPCSLAPARPSPTTFASTRRRNRRSTRVGPPRRARPRA